MTDFLSTVSKALRDAFSGVVRYAAELTPARLAWGGLALAAVTLLSVNLIASETLGGWKADLTEDRLYSISPGSVTVLKAIDEPIQARLYYSRKLGEIAPSYARYFDRIRTLLEEFQRLSGGKLQLEILDPEPFSDAEDQAVASGITGRRLNAEGEMGYFGLAARNSTDNQEVIAHLSPDRESFVEYDITKLVHGLSNPKKRVVGLMTSLPLEGGTNPMSAQSPMGPQQTPPWMIMSQIREFFDVEPIEQTVTEIPSTVDVLLVAQPTQLTPQAAYAIDQYALKGGKVLALIDPMAEAAQLELLQKQGEGRAELAKLLKTWGVGFDPAKTAADIRHARRVQFGRGDQGMVTEFVAWLGLDESNIDKRDVLSSGIKSLNVASAGILTPVEGATTTVTPILTTSPEAMEISTQKVGMSADPVALLREYAAGGKPLMLAARVAGEARTAFPDGVPKPAEKTAEPKPEATPPPAAAPDAKPKAEAAKSAPGPGHVASGRVNVIVVADTDLLADRFWVESREMLGQEFVVPSAHNSAFIVGALENLTGSDALIALRGRGIKERTFTLVEDLRRDAERKFREKEEALTARLTSVEKELEKLQSANPTGGVIASEKERETIDTFKAQLLETRRELRQVKLALRQSIDSLDGWLQFANIALVPLLIAAGGVGWGVWRARSAGQRSAGRKSST